MTHFESEILRLLAMMNDRVNQIGERLEEVQGVVVTVADDVSTVRSRQIEQASRDGEQIQRQQREIRDLDGRLEKLELSEA